MHSPLQRALAVTAAVAALCGLLHWAGVGLPLLLLLAVVTAVITNFLPWYGVRMLDAVLRQLRALHWRREQGRHHAFAGIPLRVHDDGRACWMAGADLQRVLRTEDAEDVLAARHSGRWRRDADGTLMLRVDAVVEQLASAPGRMDPRTVRLRRYLERDVLFPAAQRRRRAAAPGR